MSTRQAVEARANELGATLEPGSGRRKSWELLAPDGKRWVGTGTHTLVYEQGPGVEAPWRAMLYDMAEGLEICQDPDCPSCD